MDKKNTLLGILFVVTAFGLMIYQGKQAGEKQCETEGVEPQQVNTVVASEEKASNGSLFEKVQRGGVVKPTSTVAAKEEFYTLENDYIAVKFTSRGGAIKDVALKHYPANQASDDPYLFNEISDKPALNIEFGSEKGLSDFAPGYKLVSRDNEKILFHVRTSEGVDVYRGYKLTQNDEERDPYLIAHETKFVNSGAQAFDLKKLYFGMGALPSTLGDAYGDYLNVTYYNGSKAQFIKIGDFPGSNGFLGMGKRSEREYIEEKVKPLVWASVKNQFFTSVLTPSDSGTGVYANPLDLEQSYLDEGLAQGIIGRLVMDAGTLAPGGEQLFGMDFYVGPKEYTRLAALGENQDLVMQFGFFGFISKFLLIIMNWVHRVIPNWGWTIIVFTVLLKLILWPLTSLQVRSSKRMAKIQEPLKAIKEKYKDNPQKVQTETMKLFKEHRVNPAAGCLPLFVQLPIFLGLYFMLRTSSELRFAEFMWISDLSLPDTIGAIAGFPINILPVIMAFSMFFQMRLTPTPTTDGFQKQIFQLMPFIFLFFCYNFPSGLVLYWTVQNLLTIVQTFITNKMKDPLEGVPVVASERAKLKSATKKASGKTKSKKR